MLDPRWKDFSWLQRSSYQNHNETLALLNKLRAFEAKQLAYSCLQDNYHALLDENTVVSPPVPRHDEQEQSQKNDFDLFDMMVTNQTLMSSSIRDPELFMYEGEREIYRNENPLEWWHSHKSKYVVLSQLAFKYLCIAGTSAPSERMFSAAGHLTSDRRSRLTPENADLLLFLNKNTDR